MVVNGMVVPKHLTRSLSALPFTSWSMTTRNFNLTLAAMICICRWVSESFVRRKKSYGYISVVVLCIDLNRWVCLMKVFQNFCYLLFTEMRLWRVQRLHASSPSTRGLPFRCYALLPAVPRHLGTYTQVCICSEALLGVLENRLHLRVLPFIAEVL
jgi:hypothetical protein